MKENKLIAILLGAILIVNIVFAGIFLIQQKQINDTLQEQYYEIDKDLEDIKTKADLLIMLIENSQK